MEKNLFKVFVSLPMRDRELDEIKARQLKIFVALKSTDIFENPILLDTIHEHDIPEEENMLWYLGESIKALGRANLAIFDKDWRTARGCRIEHAICVLYNIPIMYVDSEDDHNDDE